jgi:hypothetical protein
MDGQAPEELICEIAAEVDKIPAVERSTRFAVAVWPVPHHDLKLEMDPI